MNTIVSTDTLWSRERLLHAFRRVRANGGGPGVDKESLNDFEAHLEANLRDVQDALRQGRYRPQPVRRVWVPKASGGQRPLAILTIRDRIVQRVVYDTLAPLYDPVFLDCSYGFRAKRSLQDAVASVCRHRDQGRCWVVDGDIKSCFDAIDHDLLMGMLAERVSDQSLLRLIRGWLKADVLSGRERCRPMMGACQGGVLSPLLCNIYLHGFDKAITEAGLALVRYADDWLILCERRSECDRALALAAQSLGRLRLTVNPYKTRIVHFDQGFAFLGVFFLRNEHHYLSPSTGDHTEVKDQLCLPITCATRAVSSANRTNASLSPKTTRPWPRSPSTSLSSW